MQWIEIYGQLPKRCWRKCE